jgi:hypothetical protein
MLLEEIIDKTTFPDTLTKTITSTVILKTDFFQLCCIMCLKPINHHDMNLRLGKTDFHLTKIKLNSNIASITLPCFSGPGPYTGK